MIGASNSDVEKSTILMIREIRNCIDSNKENQAAFTLLIKDLFEELSERNDLNSPTTGEDSDLIIKQVGKYSFVNYFKDLPIVLSENLYRVSNYPDQIEQEFLSYDKFYSALLILKFTEDLHSLISFVFSIFDLNLVETISIKELRRVLNFLPEDAIDLTKLQTEKGIIYI